MQPQTTKHATFAAMDPGNNMLLLPRRLSDVPAASMFDTSGCNFSMMGEYAGLSCHKLADMLRDQKILLRAADAEMRDTKKVDEDLRAELKKVSEERHELGRTLADVRFDLADARENLVFEKNQNRKNGAEIQSLRAEIATMTDVLEGHGFSLARNGTWVAPPPPPPRPPAASVAELEGRIRQLQDLNNQLERDLDERECQLGENDAKIEDLCRTADHFRDKYQQLRAELAEPKEQIKRLKRERTLADKRVEDSESYLAWQVCVS